MATEMVEENLQQREFEFSDPEASGTMDAVQRIRDKFQGVEVAIRKGSQSRQLSQADKAEALASSGADQGAISMSKRLFDRRMVAKIPQLKEVNSVLSRIEDLKGNRSLTLPHPEPGVRLLRMGNENLDAMAEFSRRFDALNTELREAVQALYDVWDEVKETAQQVLGRYYSESDYAYDPRQVISASYRFIEVDVPNYLRENPELYQREAARVRGELLLVKQMKEQEMAEGIYEVIDRISERLEPRKILDNMHEVCDVDESRETPDGMRVWIYYQPHGTSRKSDRKEELLTPEQFRERVTIDRKPKTFRDATVARLFDELSHADQMLEELAIGGGKMAEAFDRLRKLTSGKNAKALTASLKNSDGYRQDIHEKLSKIKEHLLESVVEKPRRAVLRKSSRLLRRQDKE